MQSLTLRDLLDLRSLRDVEVEQGGSFAVFSVESFGSTGEEAWPPSKGDHVRRSHLYRVELDGSNSEPRQLTHGDRRDSSPRISPDGTRLAFVRAAETEGGEETDATSRPQVWVMPLDGGGEARPVTSLEGGATGPRWSPDGRSLLVETRFDQTGLEELDGPPAWPSPRPGRTADPIGDEPTPDPAGTPAEIRAWLDANTANDSPRLVDRLDFLGEREIETSWRPRQVMVVDLDGGGEPRRIGRGVVDRFDADFGADGRSVIMVARGDDRHPDSVLDSRLEMFDLESPEKGETLFEEDGVRVSDPTPGPDGSLVAFAAQRMDEPNYRGRRIGLAPTRGGAPIWVTDGDRHDVESFGWGQQPATVSFTAGDAGATPLFTASPSTLQPDGRFGRREGMPSAVRDFDVAGETLVWVESSARAPFRLWMNRDGEDTLLFDPNSWLAERRIALPTERWVERPDGTRIQYWTMAPAVTDADGTAPVVLSIHGGPSAMWGPAEASMWLEWQLMVERGYGVVYANPRGSGGYGEAFQRANHQNWGPGPAGDCLAALEAACEEPWADPERLVVTGGSYGGYLTTWIIAHDRRFKAAVAQRGVYDLRTFFGEGNAFRLVEWAFGGHPADERFGDLIDGASPFQASRSIETPLLIMHGEKDLRTGVSQSAMLYRSLKVDGRPVEYVLYPDADHDLSRTGDPVHRMDRIARIIEFFDRYTGFGQTPGPSIGDASTPD